MIALRRASRLCLRRRWWTRVVERSGRRPRPLPASAASRSAADRTAEHSRKAVEEMSGDTCADDKSGSDLERHRAGNERDRLLLGVHRLSAPKPVLGRCLAVDRIVADHGGHLRFPRAAVGPGSPADRR